MPLGLGVCLLFAFETSSPVTKTGFLLTLLPGAGTFEYIPPARLQPITAEEQASANTPFSFPQTGLS